MTGDAFALAGLLLVIFALALGAWGRKSLQQPRGRRESGLAVRELRGRVRASWGGWR